MIGQAIGAHTDATHGMTLAAVSLPYYRLVMPYGLKKFARFAHNVWGVCPDGKTEQQMAEEGLKALEQWMQDIGVVMHSAELGVNEGNIEAIADSTIIFDAGYHKLTRDEVIDVLKKSM
jgi:alcohol dehydrogenase YqhD (iron-dependent ADH family)